MSFGLLLILGIDSGDGLGVVGFFLSKNFTMVGDSFSLLVILMYFFFGVLASFRFFKLCNADFFVFDIVHLERLCLILIYWLEMFSDCGIIRSCWWNGGEIFLSLHPTEQVPVDPKQYG